MSLDRSQENSVCFYPCVRSPLQGLFAFTVKVGAFLTSIPSFHWMNDIDGPVFACDIGDILGRIYSQYWIGYNIVRKSHFYLFIFALCYLHNNQLCLEVSERQTRKNVPE